MCTCTCIHKHIYYFTIIIITIIIIFFFVIINSSYAKNNIEKHGTNYKAMERDMKLNFMQHTEYKMQKLCERYLAIRGKKD